MRSNVPRAVLILFVALAFVCPVSADTVTGQPDTGGLDINYSLAPDGSHVTVYSQTGLFFSKLGSFDTFFGLRAFITDTNRVDTTFSDTIGLSAENTGVTAGTESTDTTRKFTIGETATFVLSLTNRGNVPDSIALVIDSAVVDSAGLYGLDTMATWSVHLYDSAGRAMGRVYTRGRDTFFIRLMPNKSETFSVRAYADSVAADTGSLSFRLQTYVHGGKTDTKLVVRAYRGFNGDLYGGDGHDSITFFAQLKPSTKLRVAKADTVFSPVSLAGGTIGFPTADTQHRIPGAFVVHTVWFDNDDSSAADTIVIEDWIDTRFVRLVDSGLSSLAASTQIAAAGTYVISGYGNIYTDSRMPINATGGAQFGVKLEYYTAAGLTPLTSSVSPISVGRIRWTISKNGGVGSLLAGTNGDATGSIDNPPLAIGAAADSDMGYVRYTVVIGDSTPKTGAGMPDSASSVSGNPATAGHDSSYLQPFTQAAGQLLVAGAQSSFVGPFNVEFLPRINIVPDSQFAQKAGQVGGDTFYFAHRIGNHGNGPDSIAISGTTALTGAYITFFKDIGSIGAFDGFEQKIDTIQVLNFADTKDILVAVFVPQNFTGTETVFLRVTSSVPAFFDTATDYFKTFGASQVTPDTAQPSIVGVGDSLIFNIFLNVPCTEDTVIIQIDTGTAVSAPLLDFTTISLDSSCNATTLDTTVFIAFSETTGILTVTFQQVPPSDTYVWQIIILDDVAGVIDTTFVDTGTFNVDTVPPYFTDTRPAMLFVVDTTLVGSETTISLRMLDTAVGDTNTGIDSIIITVMDTAGNIIRVDTVDAYLIYQMPIDTPGIYTISVVAIDMAGNTVALSDSLAVVVPVRRRIDLVAKDKAGVLQTDDIAKGLTAKGHVTVSDIAANLNPASIQSIVVTLVSDVDPIGITIELFENGANTGVFEESFGFTNGVSNTAAKKLKVRDGSPVTAIYDADGPTGPITSISDLITWQGIQVTNLDNVRTWPNPFNPITDPEIVFHNLPPDITMSIEIYSLNAEKIATLRVGDGIEFSANQNIARWNARNKRGQLVASGTYVIVVRSTLGTTVKKMTIVH